MKNKNGIYCPIPYNSKRYKLLKSIGGSGFGNKAKKWNELSKEEEEIAEKIYLGECICKEKNPAHNTSIGSGWYTIYPSSKE
tara:strand:+ start:316 stop:561 length:246 start_codon:yes stop_codon:yes gene_type:complete